MVHKGKIYAMNIGIVIKKLRREKDISQEKLSEYLSVSPQAVSRWETGATYPDITLVPAIAAFFNVSTDLLLGVDEDRREKDILKYLAEYQVLCSTGEKEKRFELIKEVRTRFPGDFRILMKYAWELTTSPYDADGICLISPQETANRKREVISVCENIIEDCPDDELRYNAIDLLSLTYAELGDTENAVKTAFRLPSSAYTRNMALYRLYDYDTEEHIKFHQENIQELTQNLWLWIRSAVWGQKNPEQKIVLCRKAIALYELMFENGDYGYDHCMIAQIYEHLSSSYLEAGKWDDAMEALELSADHILAYSSLPAVFYHTSVLFDRLTFSDDEVRRDSTRSGAENMLHVLEKELYAPIRNTERFRCLLDRLHKI